MPLPPDYHMHTPLCRHADGEPTEYAAHAVQIGLSEIGFTDHSPMPRDDFDDWRMRANELELYVEKVRKAREDHPDLTIRLGLEIDFLPGHEAWIRKLLGRHPWDYVIGSVHYLSEVWAIDNPDQQGEWEKRDVDTVWRDYFDRLTEAVATGLFDIIGHADLCKKFGHLPKGDIQSNIRSFLDAAREEHAAIEINTAGLRKPCHAFYPSEAILTEACRRGIPLTFGSDAHTPSDVGRDFAGALQLARRVGYTHTCRFTQRRGEKIPLPE